MSAFVKCRLDRPAATKFGVNALEKDDVRDKRGRGGAPGFSRVLRPYMTLDTAGHGLRLSLWLLGLAVLIQVIRPQTLQCYI